MKKKIGILMSIVLLVSCLWVPVTSLSATEGATTELELIFDSVGQPNGAKNWGFTCVDNGALPNQGQWFKVDAEVDGNSRTVLLQYDNAVPLFYIYGHCFDSTPSDTSRAPASSLKIAAGAVLTPLTDANANAVNTSGISYTVKKEIYVVYNTETCVWERVSNLASETVTDLELMFSSVSAPESAKNWAFSYVDNGALPAHGQWFRAAVDLDGDSRMVLVQYDGVGQCFYIYGHCFDAVPTATWRAPTSSLKLAQGTILIPLTEPNANFVDTTKNGYRITKQINVIYNTTTSAWESDLGISTDNAVDLELSFSSVSAPEGAKNWGFSYVDNGALPSQYQWFRANAIVDGVSRVVLIQYDSDGPYFYIYGHCFDQTPSDTSRAPTTSFQLEKDTILIPLTEPNANSVDAEGTVYKITKEIIVSYEDGMWADQNSEIDYTTYQADDIQLFDLGDQTNFNRTCITLKMPESLPKPLENEWWGTYNGTATVSFDGVPYSAFLGVAGEPNLLAIYISWPGGTTNLFANAETIVIQSGMQAAAGNDGFKLSEDLTIEKDGYYWRFNGSTAEDKMQYVDIDCEQMKLHSYKSGDADNQPSFQIEVEETLSGFDWENFEGEITIFVDGVEQGATLKKSDTINGFDLYISSESSGKPVLIPDGIIALGQNRKLGVRFNNREGMFVEVGDNFYVDTKMLSVKVQDNSTTAPEGTSKFDIRFIASVNSLDYESAGFVFSLTNDTPEVGKPGCVQKGTTTVYESFTAAGTSQHISDIYSDYSEYMYAFEIKNTPANKRIYVRAYVELEDGTFVYGDVRTVIAPEASTPEVDSEYVLEDNNTRGDIS